MEYEYKLEFFSRRARSIFWQLRSTVVLCRSPLATARLPLPQATLGPLLKICSSHPRSVISACDSTVVYGNIVMMFVAGSVKSSTRASGTPVYQEWFWTGSVILRVLPRSPPRRACLPSFSSSCRQPCRPERPPSCPWAGSAAATWSPCVTA